MVLHIKEIKKGDYFWEKTNQFVALENGQLKRITVRGKEQNQWFVYGQCLNNTGLSVVHFLVTEDLEHCGPKLTTTCEYCSMV